MTARKKATTEPVIEGTAEELPDEQPAGGALVTLDDLPENVLAVVDRHDEAMIVSEIQRRALKVMLYKFPLNGQQVTDLSYLGVNEAVRLMNNSGKWQVTIDPMTLTVHDVMEDVGNGEEPCYQATVYAVNRLTGYGQFGTYTQPKRMKLTHDKAEQRRRDHKAVADDDTIADQFARQKAVNKAQRNALRIHIPEELRQTIIAQYKGNPDAVERIQIGAGAPGLADLPPALTDARSKAQRETARELWKELVALTGPTENPPGAFHAYLTHAEHDHDRLDDLIEYMRGKIATARGDEPPADASLGEPDALADEVFGGDRPPVADA